MFRGETVSALSADAMDALARDYEQQAAYLRHKAAERRASEAAAEASRRALMALQGIPAMILAYQRGGMTVSQAIDLVARTMPCPVETAESYWRKYMRAQRKAARAARNARIMTRVEAGQSNVDIARAEGLHLSHVGRIIREMREAAPRREPATPTLSSPSADPRRTGREGTSNADYPPP